MSIPVVISTINSFQERIGTEFTEEDFNLLNQLLTTLAPYDILIQLDQLKTKLSRIIDGTEAEWNLVEDDIYQFQFDIHTHVRCFPGEEKTLAADIKRYNEMLDGYLGLRDKEMIYYFLNLWPRLFSIDPLERKQICGMVEASCDGILTNGDTCGAMWNSFPKGTLICPLCGNKRRLCTSLATNETGRCKAHGNASLMTINSNEKVAKYLGAMTGTKLRYHYLQAVENGGLNMEAEMNLLSARIMQLVEALDSNEIDYEAIRQGLIGAKNKITKAMGIMDVDTLFNQYQELLILFNKPVDDKKGWDEIRSTVNALKSLVETQRITIKEEGMLIGYDQMLELLGQTIEAVKAAVISGSKQSAQRLMTEIELAVVTAGYEPDEIMEIFRLYPAISEGDIIMEMMNANLSSTFQSQAMTEAKALAIEERRKKQ